MCGRCICRTDLRSDLGVPRQIATFVSCLYDGCKTRAERFDPGNREDRRTVFRNRLAAATASRSCSGWSAVSASGRKSMSLARQCFLQARRQSMTPYSRASLWTSSAWRVRIWSTAACSTG